MSARQNGFPVHMWHHLISSSPPGGDPRMVSTYCGKMVREESATTDFRLVTCNAKGCLDEWQERAEWHRKMMHRNGSCTPAVCTYCQQGLPIGET